MIKPVPREHYLESLRRSKGLPLIKVITGMRRCGKSTLLEMFRNELLKSGISKDDIYFRNFGNELNGTIYSYENLISDVKNKFIPSTGKYIFLDEIQNVKNWERAVETFYINGADIYVTGSNSEMLSSEISTKLSGRTIELNVLPLSFSEFILFRESYGEKTTLNEKFNEYIQWGGLPTTAVMSGYDRNLVSMMISGTYDTVFIKDVIERNNIRNSSLITNISRFLMKNIGNRTSISNVSGFLLSKGIRASPETIDSYIGYLEDARLFTRAERFDTKTKEYLRTLDKFYACDMGIRNVSVGREDRDLDGILENIVFNELMYRYGNASVVSVERKEVDFVSFDAKNEPSYYQVSVSIMDEDTRKREIGSLKAIDDNYQKTIIIMDTYPMDNIDGIRIVNILDFLTEK